ncbi:uncharacterized protein LOC112567082 isoform X1 [Pomacea canaliculata]|uniref:uncharacterized protein LOC112567082 isoform X1 n=1 Tax=Pomacea canaliculata TaxID=400727 RepID=UPI000D72A4BD|nr:uncharacterized protein LOC112567082 isoform X1 [Pomacea canaliculata]
MMFAFWVQRGECTTRILASSCEHPSGQHIDALQGLQEETDLKLQQKAVSRECLTKPEIAGQIGKWPISHHIDRPKSSGFGQPVCEVAWGSRPKSEEKDQKTLLCGWYRCKGLPEKNHAANLERQGFITVKAKEEKSVLSRGFQKCRPWYAKLYRRTVGAWRLQITSSKKAAAERDGVERRGENKSKC